MNLARCSLQSRLQSQLYAPRPALARTVEVGMWTRRKWTDAGKCVGDAGGAWKQHGRRSGSAGNPPSGPAVKMSNVTYPGQIYPDVPVSSTRTSTSPDSLEQLLSSSLYFVFLCPPTSPSQPEHSLHTTPVVSRSIASIMNHDEKTGRAQSIEDHQPVYAEKTDLADYKTGAIEAENAEHNMTVLEAVRAYPMASFWAFVISCTIVSCLVRSA